MLLRSFIDSKFPQMIPNVKVRERKMTLVMNKGLASHGFKLELTAVEELQAGIHHIRIIELALVL